MPSTEHGEVGASRPGFFQDLVQAIDGIVWEVDLVSQRFTFVSDQAERILGYPISCWQEVQFWVDLIHPDDRGWVPEFCAAECQAGRDHVMDYRAIAADGRVVWLRETCAVTMESGRPVLLRGVMVDVTALKQSEERSRALLDAIPDLMFRISREGEILDFHAPDPSALFVPPEEVVGSRIPELFPEAFSDECMACVQAAVDTGHMQQMRYELPIGGRPRQFEARIVPSGTDEALSLVSDLTHRLEFEKQVQQAQRLESLGQMAGGLAHDFNNLLVGVLGNAGLALRKLPDDSPAREPVGRIEQAARAAAELTAQLLAYSGQGRFSVRVHDLSKLVRDMSAFLRAAISKQVDVVLDCERPVHVAGDLPRLNQLVMNLVTNAADALGEGAGEIFLRTAVTELTAPREKLPVGPVALLEVIDGGCGMSPEVAERVFDPFFSTKFTGRGLGMAAVMGIVQGHGGTIEIESSVGEGTRVTVLLPLAEAPESAPAAEPVDAESAAVVMVVDDEEIVRVFAATTLEEEGFEVLVAGDGPQALELVDRHADRIDAILLDVLMPGMNGEEVIRRLREAGRQMPVVLTSGYSERDATSRFAEVDLAGFLQKPFMPEDLVEVIRGALGPRD